jgi:uncharacterized protein YbjT (DUF2867 family)
MKLIVFGATGMVGAGTLREALADPRVTQLRALLAHTPASRRDCASTTRFAGPIKPKAHRAVSVRGLITLFESR